MRSTCLGTGGMSSDNSSLDETTLTSHSTTVYKSGSFILHI